MLEDFDIELTGFSTAEFDMMIDADTPAEDDPEDIQPEDETEQSVSCVGDIPSKRS